MRANASEGRLQDALKTALADRQNAVEAGGLLGDIIEIWGGPRRLAADIHREFQEAAVGGMTRQRILEMVQRLITYASDRQITQTAKPAEMSDADLEALAMNYMRKLSGTAGNLPSDSLPDPTRVATPYSPRLGYGWLGNGGIGAADRGRRANPTTRHLNYGRDKTFLVTLANGLYDVTPTLGDAKAAHNNVSIWINNVRVASNLSTQPGQSLEPTFLVMVSNGQLKLRLAALGGKNSFFAIDALQVKPASPPKVNDVAPTVSLSAPSSGTVGTAVGFTASATDVSPADQAAGFTYNWNFGDGTTGTGASPSHAYSAAGTYTVSVTATDEYGKSGTASGAIVISSASPGQHSHRSWIQLAVIAYQAAGSETTAQVNWNAANIDWFDSPDPSYLPTYKAAGDLSWNYDNYYCMSALSQKTHR